MASQQQPHYLLLGEILRPHGIRGELRMRILTDHPERLLNELDEVYLGNSPKNKEAKLYTLKSARFHKDYLLITLEEVKSRNDAELLRGQKVMIDLDRAIPLEDGEYYLYQLIGITVQTVDGLELGEIKEVIETGANDVYIVKGREFGELLLPAHSETIVNINFDEKRITMQLPDGLLSE